MTPLEAKAIVFIAAVIFGVALYLGLSAIWGRRRIPTRWTPDEPVDMAQMARDQDELNRRREARRQAAQRLAISGGVCIPRDQHLTMTGLTPKGRAHLEALQAECPDEASNADRLFKGLTDHPEIWVCKPGEPWSVAYPKAVAKMIQRYREKQGLIPGRGQVVPRSDYPGLFAAIGEPPTELVPDRAPLEGMPSMSFRASRRDVGAFQFPPRLRGFPYDQERETR